MNPVPETTAARASRAAPSGFQPFDAAPAGETRTRDRELRIPMPTPHDPSGLELGLGALMRFRALMAVEGHEVQLARMCYDRLYAYERFALAHAGGSEPLKALALELFQIYHRRGVAARVPQ